MLSIKSLIKIMKRFPSNTPVTINEKDITADMINPFLTDEGQWVFNLKADESYDESPCQMVDEGGETNGKTSPLA